MNRLLWLSLCLCSCTNLLNGEKNDPEYYYHDQKTKKVVKLKASEIHSRLQIPGKHKVRIDEKWVDANNVASIKNWSSSTNASDETKLYYSNGNNKEVVHLTPSEIVGRLPQKGDHKVNLDGKWVKPLEVPAIKKIIDAQNSSDPKYYYAGPTGKVEEIRLSQIITKAKTLGTHKVKYNGQWQSAYDIPEIQKHLPNINKRKQSPPPLMERQEATVYAVAFGGKPGTASARGSTHPMTIRVEANTSEDASVAVMESHAGSTGNQMKAAMWMAAFTASQALGLDLSDNEFTLRIQGFIDGPSAGMLKTVTMMALLRGDKIRKDSTMTGAINPDGSTGIVGGIPQKMLGAKARGLKRFGYPVGTRMAVDLRTLKKIDLQQHANAIGLVAKEIPDLWIGYQFMTGKTLERAKPVKETEMALVPIQRQKYIRLLNKLKPQVRAEYQKLEAKIRTYNSDFVNKFIGQSVQQGVKLYKQGESFENSGQLIAAYKRYIESRVWLETSRHQLDVLVSILRKDITQIRQYTRSLATVSKRLTYVDRILSERLQNPNLGEQISTIDHLMSLVNALHYIRQAESSIQHSNYLIKQIQRGKKSLQQPQVMGDLTLSLYEPILYRRAADTILEAGEDSMSTDIPEGETFRFNSKKVHAKAKELSAASVAGIAYLDTFTADEISKKHGVSVERARNYFAQKEQNYPLVKYASAFATHEKYVQNIMGKSSVIADSFRLAFGVRSYIGTANLINKYYSLGATFNNDNTITLTHRKALTHQLEMGKRRALEAAGECKKALGFIPSASKRHFLVAVALREGDDDDKLIALEEYWLSTFWSNMALQLSK